MFRRGDERRAQRPRRPLGGGSRAEGRARAKMPEFCYAPWGFVWKGIWARFDCYIVGTFRSFGLAVDWINLQPLPAAALVLVRYLTHDAPMILRMRCGRTHRRNCFTYSVLTKPHAHTHTKHQITHRQQAAQACIGVAGCVRLAAAANRSIDPSIGSLESLPSSKSIFWGAGPGQRTTYCCYP